MDFDKNCSVELEVQGLEMLSRNIPAPIVARKLKVDLATIEKIERSVESRNFKETDFKKLSVEEAEKELKYLRRKSAKLRRQNAILKAANGFKDKII